MKQVFCFLILVPAGLWAQGQNLGIVTAKSYNLVLQADQYCSTPGTLDQTCVNNAYAACPSTGCSIHMRAGTWVPAAPIVIGGKFTTLYGDGSATLIAPAAGYSGDVIQLNVGTGTNNTVFLRDFYISPVSVLTTGACVHGERLVHATITNVFAKQCQDGFYFTTFNVLLFYHAYAVSNARYGFWMDSLAGTSSYNAVFDQGTLAVSNGSDAFLYAASTSTSDTEALVFVNGSGALQNTGAGIHITSNASARISNLWVNNGQFDLNSGGGIINSSNCGLSCSIYIKDSIFYSVGSPTTGIAIDLGTSHESFVAGNIFEGNWGDNVRDNGTYNVISDNLFQASHVSGVYGIHVQSAAIGSEVKLNRFVNDGVPGLAPYNINGILVDSGATLTQVHNNNFTGISTGISYTNNAAANTRDDVDVTFAAIGTAANGSVRYCSDCTVANPCAGAGTGAVAKRLNGVWVCN